MLDKVSLKDVLHASGLTNTDKLLLCLAVGADVPKSVGEIKQLAQSGGLRDASKWNISSLLGRSKGLAVRTDAGWELTALGRNHVASLADGRVISPTRHIAQSLRTHLDAIGDKDTAAFVEEAVLCLEHKLCRAAVVLSWVGAVAVLYGYVVSHRLAAFNAEATRRNAKWRSARSVDDLARMKESDFLDVLEAISVIGKSVKQELQVCLQLRNACGHPNSFALAESRVSAHIEVLVLNVFAKF